MKKVLLDKAQWSHWNEYRRWINQPQMMRLLDRQVKVSEKEHRLYIRRLEKDPHHCFLGVFSLPERKFIGICALKNIQKRVRKAELYICLGVRGKGYGVAAVCELLNYGFSKLKLNRIYLYTPEFNQAAIRCYRKAGFRLEGRGVQDVFSGGRYYDSIRMYYLKSFKNSPKGKKKKK